MLTMEERKALVKPYLGKTVRIEMDRPIGTPHPKHPEIIYPINYGYIPGVLGGDGEELDVYLLGVDTPVDEYTAKVIGIEAKSYYTNHAERQISTPKLTSESAKEKVFEKMQIYATRLALVPVGESEEKLCYEFYGKFDDSDYYVYIDAENGRQVEMFKVVKGTEGDFLL